MINIAFVIDKIESPTAGTEKQVLLLIKNIDRSRFTPFLCVLQSSQWLKEEFEVCELFCADITSFKTWDGICGIRRLCNFFRSNQINIVQVYFRDASIAGIIAGKLAAVQVIVTSRRNQGYWMNSRELLFQKILNRWTSACVVNSKATKVWAMQNEKIPEEKMHVIYNGLDLNLYIDLNEIIRHNIREKLEIPLDSAVVGIVANLRPVKGHEVFLQAASRILNQIKNVYFVLAGHGELRERLELQAKDLGIARHVKFIGKQQNIPHLLAAFDVGVLSSHSESFSNALIEYLATGLPIVCTDVGGARELVQKRENGHIVPPNDYKAMADAIIRILRHKSDYSGGGSLDWIQKNCSIDRAVGLHENLYEKICP